RCHVCFSSSSFCPPSFDFTLRLLLFQFYEQFDDDEIGALDNAELEGFIQPDSARLEEVIKDYFIQKEKESLRPEDLGPKELPVLKEEDEDDEEEEEMETVVIEAPEEKWDCETIISEFKFHGKRFTHPTVSSSAKKRSGNLPLFYEQFDDDEIGALDNAELEGFIQPDSARLEEVIKDYFIQKEK
ncbi:protein LTV1 homolog, partial [Plectropomus leopardus]|uniref:protein LTV1 homolog n=1 Tax=Plectropomus leopardus TaxID=160734 RepID=UPI001C4C47B3